MAPKKLTEAAMRQRRRNESLLECAMSGRHRDVERLLEEGADIEAQDREGYTPVSEAASAGHTVVVGQLLRAHADLDRPAFDGRTALHRAAFQNWLTTMRLLVDNGADPDAADRDGAMPADLARSGAAKELLAGVDREASRAKREERRLQREAAPRRVAADADEVVVEDEPTAAADAAPAPETFEPPPRVKETRQERQQKAREAREAAKAERERRYQEALSEIAALANQVDENGTPLPLAEAPLPLVARVEVHGAGERRLNGAYHVDVATKERVEFRKETDEQCQIVWTSYHNEWRMLVGDYKMGNTLYRHKYRPNVRADENLGCPLDGWTEWFGRGPTPSLRSLGEDDEVEEEASDDDADAAAAPAQGVAAVLGGVAAGAKPAEFLEVHSNLEIVKKDLGAIGSEASAQLADVAARSGMEISLTGGERLVETADGLFSPAEVRASGVEDVGGAGTTGAAVEEIDDEKLAEAWIEDLAGAPEVPPVWDAIQAAKVAAQDLFAEGKVDDARQATTAAIRAAARLLEKLSNPGEDEELPLGGGRLPAAEEVENIIGVLHSNRSLLVLRQIEAGDRGALQRGPEAAWGLVAKDAGKALAIDRTNFKASFRRARALYETGDLEAALEDASRVVEHYARNSSTPNPEAAALRERIIQSIQKERQKWGQKAPVRWNRASHEQPAWQEAPLIAELGGSRTEAAAERLLAARSARAGGGGGGAAAGRAAPSAAKGPSAPRTGSDIEKALLVTLRASAEQRAAYVREHVPAEAVRKFFRRAPLGPDLLAALIRVLADISGEDPRLAGEVLGAIAAAPSAQTQAAMFDADERGCLQRLVERVGPEAAAFWCPKAPDEEE